MQHRPYDSIVAVLTENFNLFRSYGISIHVADSLKVCKTWRYGSVNQPSLTLEEFNRHLSKNDTWFAAVAPEGVVILDFDLKEFDSPAQLDATVKAVLSHTGRTLTVQTQNGGIHVYVRPAELPDEALCKFKMGADCMIVGDLKYGQLGYGMMAGSGSAAARYTLLDGSPIADVPSLLDIGVHPSRKVRTQVHSKLTAPKTSEPLAPNTASTEGMVKHFHLLPNSRKDGATQLRANCPICQDDNLTHNGVLTVNTKTGAYTCHNGCASTDVYSKVMSIAERAGFKEKLTPKATMKGKVAPMNEMAMTEYREACSLNVPYDEIIDQRYLPVEIADRLTTGIGVLNSAKGTGKSFLLRRFVKRVVAAGYRVAFAYHRRSLCGKIAKDCGLQFVADESLDSDHAVGWALCYNSLHKLCDTVNTSKVILVLDECESGLAHVVGTGISASDRQVVLAALKEILTNAPQVILSDADMSDVSLNHVKHYRPDDELYAVLNTHVGVCYNVDLYSTKVSEAEVTRRLAEDLSRGKRVMVTTDSKVNSYILKKIGMDGDVKAKVEDVTPLNVTVLHVCADTRDDPKVKAFIADPDTYLELNQPQLVILTPTVDCGLSIDSSYFDICYGFNCGVLGVMQASQALSRVRAPVNRVVWVAPKGINTSPDTLTSGSTILEVYDSIYAEVRAIGAQKLKRGEQVDMDWLLATGDRLTAAHPLETKLYSTILARSNFSRYYHAECFTQQLRKEGHTITDVSGEDARFKEVRESKKAEHLLAFATELASAAKIDYTEYSELVKCQTKTYAQSLQVMRYRLAEFNFGGTPEAWELTADVDFILKVKVENRGKMLNQCELYLELRNGCSFTQNATAESKMPAITYYDDEDEVFAPDEAKKRRVQRLELLERLNVWGIFLASPDREHSEGDTAIKQLAQSMRWNRVKLHTAFELNPPKAIGSPFKEINNLLDKVGLQLKPRNVRNGSDWARLYYLAARDEVATKCVEALLAGIIAHAEREKAEQLANEHSHF